MGGDNWQAGFLMSEPRLSGLVDFQDYAYAVRTL